MNSGEKVRSERRFQVRMNLGLVVLGAFLCAFLGFGASWWLQLRDEFSRKEAVLRVMCSSIKNDLSYTVGVTEGLREGNLKKKNWGGDATLFRLLYHPSVILPDTADVGRLDVTVVNAFDEYKRMLAECEARRQEHIQTLQSPDHNNVEVTLFTYLVGLDAVILRGAKLLGEVEAHYPGASCGHSAPLTSYRPLRGFADSLSKAMNEAIAERLKTQHVTNRAEPTAPPNGGPATPSSSLSGLGEGRHR